MCLCAEGVTSECREERGQEWQPPPEVAARQASVNKAWSWVGWRGCHLS